MARRPSVPYGHLLVDGAAGLVLLLSRRIVQLASFVRSSSGRRKRLVGNVGVCVRRRRVLQCNGEEGGGECRSTVAAGEDGAVAARAMRKKCVGREKMSFFWGCGEPPMAANN